MDKSQTSSQELEILEEQVEAMFRLIQQLKEENTSLRNQQVALHQERSHLMEKNEVAKSRVEGIISRLKSLESNE